MERGAAGGDCGTTRKPLRCWVRFAPRGISAVQARERFRRDHSSFKRLTRSLSHLVVPGSTALMSQLPVAWESTTLCARSFAFKSRQLRLPLGACLPVHGSLKSELATCAAIQPRTSQRQQAWPQPGRLRESVLAAHQVQYLRR